MNWFKRLGELIADWQWLARRDGWQKTWLDVFKEIVQLPYRRLEFVVFALDLTKPITEAPSKVPVEIRPFAAADLDFVRREHLPSEATLCAQHLQLGHHGFAACIAGQIVGYAWLCTDTTLERVTLRFEAGDLLVSDAFTAPSARGKGVHTVLSQARMRWAREHGYRRVLAYVEVHNGPSLKVWREKMKAEEIAHITFTRIGFWRQTKYAA